LNPVLKFALVVVAAAVSTTLYAQKGELKGTVYDSSGAVVPSTDIMVEGTKLITSTDENGNYHIKNVPTGERSVLVSVLGYNPLSGKVIIIEGKTAELNFKMSQRIIHLKEVSVKSTISVNGMGHLNEVHDGVIYSGKKTEVLVLDSINANTAQNNPREVLGRIPGSNYSETEGGGFPSNGIAFRGLRPTQSIETQTRQNGYNIAADLYGYPETYYMPPLEALDRIEIIRGASSLQFGPQFGGIVNFITKSAPENKPFEFTTSQTAGSYGFFDSFYSVGGTIKKWSYSSYVQYKTTKGFREHSDVSQVSAFAKVEYRISECLKIGGEYSLLRNRIHMPGGLTDGEFEKGISQSYRARNWLQSPWNIAVLSAEYKPIQAMLVTLKSSLNTSARDLVWRNEDGGPGVADSISAFTNEYVPREVQRESFNSVTTELRTLTYYKIKGIEHTVAAGVRYFTGTMKRSGGGPGSTNSDLDLKLYGGNYEYNLDFSTVNIAPFIENTFHVSKRLSVTPGFRYEYIKSSAKGYVTDDNTSATLNTTLGQWWQIPLWGIGAQYKTTNTTNVYANISESYEPTNYSNLTPVGVASVIDPHMKDVSGYNADFGWRGSIKGFLNFDVGAFCLAFNDEIGIETLEDRNGNPYTYRTNVGNSVHKGIESYVELNPFKLLHAKPKIGNLSFFNSYSYIDAGYVSGPYKGNSEEMAPRNIERLGINFAFAKYVSTTFLISYSSKSYGDANNTIRSDDATVGLIPAYRVLDWATTVKIKKFQVKLGVTNLTDTKYFNLRTDEYPGPGIIPAMGRSVYAGVGAKF
jgi:Fe(3+) dicitrate transport protein